MLLVLHVNLLFYFIWYLLFIGLGLRRIHEILVILLSTDAPTTLIVSEG